MSAARRHREVSPDQARSPMLELPGRRAAPGILLVLLITGTGVPVRAQEPSLFHDQRPAMGTTFEVYLYASGEGEAQALFETVFEEVERIEGELSTYRATSELSRINAAAAHGPVTTDPEVFGLLADAMAWSRRSQGAYDITVGPLVKAWGFFRGEGRYPDPEELARARGSVGWRGVRLDETERTVRFLSPGIELDLGGGGKGYALDRAAVLLRELGVESALLSAGQSSYYALGAPPGAGGWRIQVPHPVEEGRTISTVEIRDGSLSTSGSTEKHFVLEGTRYHHIFDPRTGHPVQGTVQVTVTAPGAADSDALSTALFVLGARDGAALVREVPGASALLVSGPPWEMEVSSVNWPAEVDWPRAAQPGFRRR
ncbi:FAD:protein FMN transferase [Gemmatimonadota bacterium]